jgi:hypothetical protein
MKTSTLRSIHFASTFALVATVGVPSALADRPSLDQSKKALLQLTHANEKTLPTFFADALWYEGMTYAEGGHMNGDFIATCTKEWGNTGRVPAAKLGSFANCAALADWMSEIGDDLGQKWALVDVDHLSPAFARDKAQIAKLGPTYALVSIDVAFEGMAHRSNLFAVTVDASGHPKVAAVLSMRTD